MWSKTSFMGGVWIVCFESKPVINLILVLTANLLHSLFCTITLGKQDKVVSFCWYQRIKNASPQGAEASRHPGLQSDAEHAQDWGYGTVCTVLQAQLPWFQRNLHMQNLFTVFTACKIDQNNVTWWKHKNSNKNKSGMTSLGSRLTWGGTLQIPPKDQVACFKSF